MTPGQRYNRSEKGRARFRRYQSSETYKAAQRMRASRLYARFSYRLEKRKARLARERVSIIARLAMLDAGEGM